MNRQLGVLRVFSGFCVAALSVVTFSQEEVPSKPRVPGNPFGQPDQTLVNEINAIRSQLGDGVAERLGGLVDDDQWKELAAMEFNQELKRLVGQSPTSQRPATTLPQLPRSATQPSISQSFPDPIAAPRRQTSIAENTQVHLGRPSVFRNSVGRLRNAARLLDAIAADLEEAKLFSEADEIRGQAEKFWRKAREFEARELNQETGTIPPGLESRQLDSRQHR